MSKIRKVFGFVGLVLAMFMGALDATIVNIALPDIMKHLNSSLTDTIWVSTIYVLGMAAFIITASKLADLYGRRLVMLICVAIFPIYPRNRWGNFDTDCFTNGDCTFWKSKHK